MHREGRPDVGLAGGVGNLERLIVHADLVGRHVEQAGLRRVARWLLFLAAERRRADAFGVHVDAVLVRGVLGDHLRTAGLMSTSVAQFTAGSYFSATSSSPVTRSRV